ncbi:MAG TPA: hypothetical protein VHU77_07585 [Candidatus Limnocylindria bacterium]|jgi:hypothetical protein|nr:hypothetical protein [Candidatus Limnocylindria bacterium]
MTAMERARQVAAPWLSTRALRQWRPAALDPERALPIGAVVAIGLGLVAIAVLTPIAGRGDYGQWLMTSRFYLGEPIPAYRDVPALPPFVPILLAGIRLLVTDPVIALEVLNGLLLAALCATFYLLGTTLLSSRWAGVLAAAIGFLVTDRFLELFAFGGLLQSSAITFMGLSLVAFARAATGPTIERKWWLAGTAALALAVLSHVATGIIALPVSLVAAALALVPRRALGWRPIGHALLPLLIGLVAIAAYWALVLLPASTDYVTNPASLAYRGPERLFASLFSYWPTSAVVVLGAAAIGLGSLGALLRRRVDGYILLLTWLGATWGSLAFSMVSGAATDYPRFATVLLAPLVVGAAGAAMWLVLALARYVRDLQPRVPQLTFVVISIVLLCVVATPFAVQRYGRQAIVYQPRDAANLTSAAISIDQALGGQPGAVLTDVREGKWLEGITGREALFSLPVRYAFRPIEWQRSLDADALLRSTATLTSGLVTGMFVNERARHGTGVPADLLVRANHGGEFVDVLRLNQAAIEIGSGRNRISAASLVPGRATRVVNPQEASLSTVWTAGSRPRVTFLERATVWKDGAALGVTMEATGHRLAATLSPPAGSTWTISNASVNEATVCLPQVGDTSPCVRVWIGQADGTLSATTDGGGLRVSSSRDHVDLLVTAITAGKASTGLDLIDPAQLVFTRDVRAALLWTPDPSFGDRSRRLEDLGFHATSVFGPYQVMLRDAP